MEEAQAEIPATEAEVARTKFDYDRYRDLSNAQFASQQRFQQADADYKKALAAERKARAAWSAAQRQIEVIETQKAQARAAHRPGLGRARNRPAEPVLYRNTRAHRWRRRQSQRAIGAYATVGRAIAFAGARARPVGRRQFQGEPTRPMHPGQQATVVADVAPAESSKATWRALRRPPARNSASCRPKTPPAISPRSSSAWRCGFCWTAIAPRLGQLRPGLSVTAKVEQRGESRAMDGVPPNHRCAPEDRILPFAVMCIGMFMALLDIQIVASSLQDIGGGLSAAQDEISLGADDLSDRGNHA